MKLKNIEYHILAHLGHLPAESVFERTLECIALDIGCSRQYVGRLISKRLLSHKFVRRDRFVTNKVTKEGEPHIRKSTWLYYLTQKGLQYGKKHHMEVVDVEKHEMGAYSRRYEDGILAIAVKEEHRGSYSKAEKLYKRALKERRLKEIRAWVLSRLSAICYDLSDYQDALDYVCKAERELRNSNSPLRADIYIARAVVFNDLFRTVESRKILLKAKRIFQDNGDVLGEAVATHNIAYSYGNEGRVNCMFRDLSKALELFERAGDKEWLAFELWTLATQKAHHGCEKEGLSLNEKALTLSKEIGDTLLETRILSTQGLIFMKLSDWKRAREFYNNALSLALTIRNRRAIADIIVAMTKLAIEEGDMSKAYKLLDRMSVLANHPEFEPTRRWMEIGDRK